MPLQANTMIFYLMCFKSRNISKMQHASHLVLVYALASKNIIQSSLPQVLTETRLGLLFILLSKQEKKRCHTLSFVFIQPQFIHCAIFFPQNSRICGCQCDGTYIQTRVRFPFHSSSTKTDFNFRTHINYRKYRFFTVSVTSMYAHLYTQQWCSFHLDKNLR